MNNVTHERWKYIGGSDLPNILGFNEKFNKSPFEFAKEKAQIIPNTFSGNEHTRYGQLMEPIIRDYINAKYQVNYVEDTIINEEKCYRGNTDGIDRNADIPILEVKTFSSELNVDYYEPQCQFYMETFDKDACLLVGYKKPDDFYLGLDFETEHDDKYFNTSFDENNLVIHTIYRDKDKWNQIEKRIEAFKNCVAKLRENNEMTEEEFNNLFYGNDIISLTNEISVIENQLKAFKDIETKYKDTKEKLYKVFEENGIDTFKTNKIQITRIKPTSSTKEEIDSKKLKVEEPEIYEKYKTTKTTNRKGYVVITIKEKENEKD